MAAAFAFHWIWIGLEYLGLGARRIRLGGLDSQGKPYDEVYLSAVGAGAALALCLLTGFLLVIALTALRRDLRLVASVPLVSLAFAAVTLFWMAIVYPEAHFLLLPQNLAEKWDKLVIQQIPVLRDIHWHRGFRRHLLFSSIGLSFCWLSLTRVLTRQPAASEDILHSGA